MSDKIQSLSLQARLAFAAISYAHQCQLTGRYPLKGVEVHAIYQSAYLQNISHNNPMYPMLLKEAGTFPNPAPIPLEVLQELSDNGLVCIDTYEDWYYDVGLSDIEHPLSKEESLKILNESTYLDWTAKEALLYTLISQRFEDDLSDIIQIGAAQLGSLAYGGITKGKGRVNPKDDENLASAISDLKRRNILYELSQYSYGIAPNVNFEFALACMPQDQYALYQKFTGPTWIQDHSMYQDAVLLKREPFTSKACSTYTVTPSLQGQPTFPEHMPTLYSELERIEKVGGTSDEVFGFSESDGKPEGNVIVIPVPDASPFTREFLTNILSKGDISMSIVKGEVVLSFTLRPPQV